MMRNNGYSLIELLIVMLLFTLMMGGVYSMLFMSQATFEAQQDAQDLRQQARVAMKQIVPDLRMAGYDLNNVPQALLDATASSLQFAGDIDVGSADPPCAAAVEAAANGGVERITLRLVAQGAANNLVRTVDCWDGAVWTNEYTDQVVASNVINAGFLLRYFDENGNELVPGGPGLTTAERDAVRTVSISLSLLGENNQVVGDSYVSFQLTTRVKIRNAGG